MMSAAEGGGAASGHIVSCAVFFRSARRGMSVPRPQQVAAGLSVIFLLAACGGSSGGGTGGGGSSQKGPLVIGAFNPFSGPDSAYGVLEMSGCIPAARVINAAGGVMGHTVKCQTFDTRGDPADAVLAAHQMIGSTSNLVGVLGPSSDEDAATLPIINQAHIPMFENAGDLAYQRGHYPYYWRTLPADYVAGYAMALWGHKKGFTRGAALFGNDIAAQGNVPGLRAGFKKLGGTITINEQLAVGQTSYQTELSRALATNPQVIFTETDPRSAAVMFSELKALGKLLPVVGSPEVIADPNYVKALRHTIGNAGIVKYVSAVSPYALTSGPAWSVYNHALLKSGSQVSNPAQYSTDSYSEDAYDNVIIMALAMQAAKSTDPSVYNNFITKVSNASPGAAVVHDFAAGKAALAAGKSIQYVGTIGPLSFDSTHNSPGLFAGYLPTNGKVLGVMSTASISALLH
jgi:branched-chain amino acid transport system substrate-binding protein